MGLPENAASSPLVACYLEIFRACAGGPSVVNTIIAHLPGLRNSGLTRWRITVLVETVGNSREDGSPVS